MLERPSTTQRFTKGFTAAVIAVAALILAANAGPARATEPGQQYATHTAGITDSAERPDGHTSH
ncbi:hypothetical protein AB0I77_49875 [Streptomyces sp. NPDC050619]|uniref:hypothetical protein n=1 Tax=Streptomyces sp. NPDC050619 TaxID=3157214 RepID=UPI003447257D